MRTLVTGSRGLLAHGVRQLRPAGLDLVFCEREQFDLTNRERMARVLKEIRPELVINTAAYNLVDRCEQERELSWAVNATGPQDMAELCAAMQCRLIHFSSDYVFDGVKRTPYRETDKPAPLNHYGAGKLHGETAVLQASKLNLVLRTSWLFGAHPTQTKSFVHWVLRQAGSSKLLKVTTDQIAAPTYAPDLARWTIDLAIKGAAGLFHAVNDEGLSRYEWARSILASSRRVELLASEPEVEPVLNAHFGASMRRPVYTVLDNAKLTLALGYAPGSWRPGLERTLEALRG